MLFNAIDDFLHDSDDNMPPELYMDFFHFEYPILTEDVGAEEP